MATQVRLRGGNAAQIAAFVGGLREVTVNTDDHTLQVHDGETPGGFIVQEPLDQRLLKWAYAGAFQPVSTTLRPDGAIVTASIVWPDGTSGTFTADAFSATFAGTVDAWHATYVGVTTRTITQPLVTRDANGVTTVRPQITLS